MDRGLGGRQLAQPRRQVGGAQIRLAGQRGRDGAPHPGSSAVLVQRDEPGRRYPAAIDGRERGSLACDQPLRPVLIGQRRRTTSVTPLGASMLTRSISAVIPPCSGATAVTRARG